MTDHPHKRRLHQIGTVADRVGLSLRTIRHYEEVGLVVPTGRSAGGFRLYTDADIERLHQVKAMKPLDFSLEETRELMALRDRLAGGEVRADGEVLADDERARLHDFAERAQRRCGELERQLTEVHAVAGALRTEMGTLAGTRRGGMRSATGGVDPVPDVHSALIDSSHVE